MKSEQQSRLQKKKKKDNEKKNAVGKEIVRASR